MFRTSRREFMQQSGTALAGAAALAWGAPSRAAGANERVRVALMGCGGRAQALAAAFTRHLGADLVALVDVHQGRLKEFADRYPTARTTDDVRRVLDDDAIDAVIIATPVHWHAPASVLACNAGKHVYVEKPFSHNVCEGRLVIDASQRNNRFVQQGTQVRSTSTIREGVRMLHEGVIGDVLVARAWNIQLRPGAGAGDPVAPPAELNYDHWLGPVPVVPYHTNTFTGWNWLRHFGTGEIGNDGIHDIEYARWGLGVETHPVLISGVGGRFIEENEAEFPDTQQVTFEYAPSGPHDKRKLLIYEERLWSTNYPYNCDSGVEFYGTAGQMFLSRRGKLQIWRGRNEKLPVDVELKPQDTDAHVADFVDAIRNNRQPSANAEVAHLTTSLCHLGNIAVRMGRSLQFDPETERFSNDVEADRLLSRTYREEHWGAPQGV
ncbi:MAG: Gfo/Idh/MocA family oxidoreductase [Planctomycetaceae bacterium]|nr:Gfo/Idh/MocA family oxidoreductase [Planctomycetaceae bacterium]